ncbi:MAG: tRNA preQ1(34) S-adenosylmethionine ribosyltransferase-isomerase QueA [Planctomycetota bacterium]|nr:tRNA preQ1(34) S-adenosylmethionine ribosyltransferase-isomerase QueA [Planctomycetota bacterium]MDA1212913.1 tRNA preQ1(34) S-adenosylmethionine ribosyltransferase-isomerase QueA [Planctomycetota bacterium]
MNSSDDDLSSYDYLLPEELIARYPLEKRDASRMLVVDRSRQKISHQQITDLPAWLNTGDRLILNNTRVVPARLVGHRAQTGGAWEGLFLGATESGLWKIIGQTRGRLQTGEQIALHPPEERSIASGAFYHLRLEERLDAGVWLARPETSDDPFRTLNCWGSVPLPPYLKRTDVDPLDRERYQTVYAAVPGAVAAPTAGLHFTPDLLNACEEKGIARSSVTLHVGLGTFRPIAVDNLSQHEMHTEWCELPETTASEIQTTQKNGGRVIAVGTTSVRTLESICAGGPLRSWAGETNLFIRPGFDFRCVQGLLTNFHLPKSTLYVLVCAFAGRKLIHEAYQQAIAEKYRFFSYGDAMLIV